MYQCVHVFWYTHLGNSEHACREAESLAFTVSSCYQNDILDKQHAN